MRRFFIISISIISAIGFASSCLNDKGVSPPLPDGSSLNLSNGCGDTTTTSQYVCFDKDILPVLSTNCALSGCHDDGTRASGYLFTNYTSSVGKGIVPGKSGSSSVYNTISGKGKRMPPQPNTPLTSDQIALIEKWINQGARHTTCSSPIDTASASITFNKTIQLILKTYCIGCHDSGTNSGDIVLENYSQVKKHVDDGKLYGSITYSSGYKGMPQGSKMSDCEIIAVKKWIDQGAPNN